jgi:hypothetical protein
VQMWEGRAHLHVGLLESVLPAHQPLEIALRIPAAPQHNVRPETLANLPIGLSVFRVLSSLSRLRGTRYLNSFSSDLNGTLTTLKKHYRSPTLNCKWWPRAPTSPTADVAAMGPVPMQMWERVVLEHEV